MKKLIIYTICAVALAGLSRCDKEKSKDDESASAAPETATGLGGDNFDLYATLEVFKESKTPEEFEKRLNSSGREVNNLDLNNDGKVDFLRVVDETRDNAHTIIIRDPVSEKESQDIAVIEIAKTGDRTAHIQIVGDEALYGKDFIVEPKTEHNKAGFVMVSTTAALNVWPWPIVEYIYEPGYVVYVSPWYYAYYPEWYEPYTPVAYEVYHPRVVQYHAYYYRPDGYRFVKVHEHYAYNVRQSTNNIYHGEKRGWAGGKKGSPPARENAGYDRQVKKPAPALPGENRPKKERKMFKGGKENEKKSGGLSNESKQKSNDQPGDKLEKRRLRNGDGKPKNTREERRKKKDKKETEIEVDKGLLEKDIETE
jgi:hypothetical protein